MTAPIMTYNSAPLDAATAWQCLPFNALDTLQLYALLRLRSQVFVVEQNCVFQDMDGRDAQALHVLGTQGQGTQWRIVAAARCFPPGVTFEEASLGRVVTDPQARGTGLGHALVAQAITALQAQWGPQPIRIGAQAHLGRFYAQHGFVDQGKPYLEDGIAHIDMLRPA